METTRRYEKPDSMKQARISLRSIREDAAGRVATGGPSNAGPTNRKCPPHGQLPLEMLAGHLPR